MATPASSPRSRVEQLGDSASPAKLPLSKMAGVASTTGRLSGALSVHCQVEGPALLIGGDGDCGKGRVRS